METWEIGTCKKQVIIVFVKVEMGSTWTNEIWENVIGLINTLITVFVQMENVSEWNKGRCVRCDEQVDNCTCR